jgi:sulfite exporter TauE/SafE
MLARMKQLPFPVFLYRTYRSHNEPALSMNDRFAYGILLRYAPAAMETVDHLSMFLLGLLGTGHCVGMCGPLVLAFPASSGRFAAHLMYHLGRLFTYTAVGALMGGIGAGLGLLGGEAGRESLLTIARVQVFFSSLAAVFMFYLGLARLGIVREPAWMAVAKPSRIPGFSRLQANALSGKSLPVYLVIGLVLGFLPCGLSFAAFARALPAGGAPAGALAVLVFGLGTVPGLLLLGTGASRFARRHGRTFDLLSGLLMIGMAARLFVDVLTV